MKTIVIDGTRVLAAGDAVRLFPDHGIINPGPEDEAGNIYEGEHLLYVNDSMALAEVEALPDPWVPGAYDFADGLFVLDRDSEAWQGHLALRAEEFRRLVHQYDGHVQKRLDSVAASFGYGDPNRPEISPILHAISYADEPAIPKFQAEGQLLRAWRSLYWAACWPILEAVRQEQRAVPTEAELIAELDAAAPPPTVAEVNAKIAELTA